MRVLGDLTQIAITWPFGHFWSPLFRTKIFSSLCTLSAYKLEVNSICASAFGLLHKGSFLGDVLNTSLGPPYALFQKMRVLGDLAKIAITWPFGQY